jgi:WD40 repeat protein
VLEENEGPNRVAIFAPSGATVLTWGDHGTGRLWDLGGRALHTFRASANPIHAAAISVDDLVATAAYDEDVVRIWAPDSELPVATLAAGYHSSIAFTRDGTKLATVSGGSANVWDARTGALLISVDAAPGPVPLTIGEPRSIAVGFDPTGARLVTGTSVGGVRIWDTSTGALAWESRACGGDFLGFDFVAGETNLAVVTKGSVCLLDASTGDLIVYESTARMRSARMVGVSADGESIAAPEQGESVTVIDARTGEVTHIPRG